MDLSRRSKGYLVALLVIVGVVALFGLTVYPYQYSLAESLFVVGAVVGAAVIESVLDDTTI